MKILVVTILLFGCSASAEASVDVGSNLDEHGLILPNGVSYSGPHYVLQATNFTVGCRLSDRVHLKWTKDGVAIATNDKRYRFNVDDRSYRSQLVVIEANARDTGSYKCYSYSQMSHNVTIIHEIVTNEAKKGQGFVLEFGTAAVLQCSASEGDKVNMTWLKNGAPLSLTEGKYSIEKGNNNTLTILKPELSDAARYTCAIEGDPAKNAHIELKTRASVEKFEKSMNLVQGDKLRLYCKVFGYPLPTVTWFKDNVPLREANGTSHVKLLADDRNVSDAILQIERLEEGDRAQYVCMLTNDVNSVNTTIMVRVKDKLAALWPFLGILAEVAILCTIIFIYEKRRAKQEYDESDTDQNNESKPVGDQKDKEVRQRK